MPPIPTVSRADRLRELTALLESIAADRRVLDELPDEERDRLLRAIAYVYSPDRYARRRQSKAETRERKASRAQLHDQLKATCRDPHASPQAGGDHAERVPARGLRAARRSAATPTPRWAWRTTPETSSTPESSSAPGRSRASRSSRSTATSARRATPSSTTSTISCARRARAFNFAKRTELADLRGRVALLTGGRVKIGYQAGLKLLRCGAHVIVTTRFPRDSAMRYAREPDFHEWADRLEIFGLDLRHTPSVEAFCRELVATRPRLDFIVNNACQTVRRPPDFYAHMMAGEQARRSDMPEHVRVWSAPTRACAAITCCPKAARP